MQLLAQAWFNNLLPTLLTDSLSFNEFIACVSKGSFIMPGGSKVTEAIDETCEKEIQKLKVLLQQSTSVSLTTATKSNDANR